MYQPFSFMSAAGGGDITEGLIFRVDIEDGWTQDADIVDSVGGVTFRPTQPGNIQFVEGPTGYWDSDNVNDYATGSADFILPSSSNAEFTIEWLFYPTALNARYGATFNYWGNDSNTNQSWWFGHANSNGQLHVNMRDGGNSLNYNSVNNAIVQDEWNHHVFACTLGDEMVVYRNGAEVDSTGLSSIVQFDRLGSGAAGSFPSLWKQSQTSSTNTALGRLASVRVYDFAFTQDDVTTQYNYWDNRGYSFS